MRHESACGWNTKKYRYPIIPLSIKRAIVHTLMITTIGSLKGGVKLHAENLQETQQLQLTHQAFNSNNFKINPRENPLKQKAKNFHRASPPTSLEFLFSLEEIKNKHYHTPIQRILGKTSTVCSISAQEEKPRGLAPWGDFILLVTPMQNQTPTAAIDLDSIKGRPRKYWLGDSPYQVAWKKWGISPQQYTILFTPLDEKLYSYTIPIMSVFKAVYASSTPLGKIPLRIAVFSKYKAPNESWIMLLKDGLENIDPSGYAKSIRLHVDLKNVPFNLATENPTNVTTVNFNGYSINLAQISESLNDEKSPMLYLKARPLVLAFFK